MNSFLLRTIVKNVILLVGIVFLFLPAAHSYAQDTITGVRGHVYDASTNERLPFVQVGFVGTHIGTSTDMDGAFFVSNSTGADTVRFMMMGYEPVTYIAHKGRITRNAKIMLKRRTTTMETVTIRASRNWRNRYQRRDNPAVELVNKVIEHKDRNREKALGRYYRDVYEKTTLALDDFHPDFESKRFWRKFRFIEKYIDETPFDATPILTISMRETMMRQTWLLSKRQNRTLITAKRQEGLDQLLGQEGLDESLGEMFVPIDIYDNDIELMMNHFTSPLHSSLATVFYRFYITDTLMEHNRQCIELSFVPANERSYGFTGQMYIAMDGSYSVVKYNMRVAPKVNLNFVRDLTVIQSYQPLADSTDTVLVPARCDTYGRIFIHKKLQEVYAHQVRVCHSYDLSDTSQTLPDSLFGPLTTTARLPKTFMRRKLWNELRPIELSAKETVIDSLRYELARLPEMKALKRIAEISISGYIPTNKTKDSSRFDIGPIYNIASYNNEEGWRFRLGGMTTAALNNRNFGEGYIAYGTRDHRIKFNTTYIHTLEEKKHHAHESPMGMLSLSASYELEVPGQGMDLMDRDNIFASTNIAHNVQYVTQGVARLRKEWNSHIYIDTWIAGRMIEPAGTLRYEQILDNGKSKTVERLGEAEWMGKIAYSPYEVDDPSKPASGTSIHVRRNAPVMNLTLRAGRLSFLNNDATDWSDGSFFARTDVGVEKRFAMGIFGYADWKLKAAAVWGKVPYPRLCMADGNDNIFISNSSFNTMRPMEMVMDKYVAMFLTYHMKGLILNNIPLINRLRLREVASFNILWGRLSDRNNPNLPGNNGLFRLQEGTSPIGTAPYMEMSIGVENIFKLIRIDFVRRLSYSDGMTNKERNSIRIGFRFEL